MGNVHCRKGLLGQFNPGDSEARLVLCDIRAEDSSIFYVAAVLQLLLSAGAAQMLVDCYIQRFFGVKGANSPLKTGTRI